MKVMGVLKQKYFSANSVISAITWLIVTMMMIVAILVISFLSVLDGRTIEDSHDRVSIAFNYEKSALLKLNIEYSYWDRGYEKTVKNPSPEWRYDTYQKYLIPAYELSFVTLIHPDNRVELLGQKASEQGYDSASIQPLFSSAIKDKVELLNSRNQSLMNKAFFSQFDGSTYLVSVEPFRHEKTGAFVDGTHLVLARKIDAEYLSKLTKQFKLPTLSLVKSDSYDAYYELEGIGQSLPTANLYWSIERMTNQLVPAILAILGVFLIITIVLARVLLNKDLHDIVEYQTELYSAAMTDSLTGVANRRYFLEFGNKSLLVSVVQKKPLTVLVLDLDHFKKINDRFGHPIGDAALRHFCETCQKYVRHSDLIGRVGGEEFAIALPHTGLEQSLKLAEELRVMVSESQLEIEGHQLHLSVSIGAATLDNHSSFEELLADADQALYQAKKSGRNRVEKLG